MGSIRAGGRSAVLLVAVLAEALLAAGRPADAACRVRLDIDPAASTLVLTSNNALRPRQPPFSDIPSPSSFARNVSRGFSGSLYASNAALAACPAADDAAAWLAAWPAFNLSSEAQPTLYQAISVYPRLNLGRTAVARPGTYDYNVSAIEVRLLATGPAATPAATPGPGGRQLQLEVPLRTLLLSGYLSTSNAITGSRYDSIANLTSNSTVPATLRWRRRGRATLVLELPQLSLNYAAVSTLAVGSQVFDAFANYTFTGRMLAKASRL